MKLDAMIDLETLATDDNAIIATIGIVKMDMDNLVVLEHDPLYVSLDWNDQHRLGRICHPSTVRWWLQQSEEARAALYDDPKPHNPSVLAGYIAGYMEDVEGVWGNGADFDCKLMQSLYKSYELRAPWKYSQHRCFRTMKNLYGGAGQPERVGTHHNALDDAIFQARWLMKILREQRKIVAVAAGDPEEFEKYR